MRVEIGDGVVSKTERQKGEERNRKRKRKRKETDEGFSLLTFHSLLICILSMAGDYDSHSEATDGCRNSKSCR